MTPPPDGVLKAFDIVEEVAGWARLTGGHIHDTWVATISGGTRFVVQAINTSVFRDIDACEHNLSLLDHWLGGSLIPRFRRTTFGAVHWLTPCAFAAGTAVRGSTTTPPATPMVWRVTEFAEGTVGAASASSASQGHEAARAFGAFVHRLQPIPVNEFAVTIARFHDLGWRITQLAEAANDDDRGRAKSCRREIDRVRATADAVRLPGDLPVRIVHNDAKIANVRFAAGTGAAVVIVDLDTTMGGSLLYDVGELIRSGCTDAREDDVDAEVDRSRVEAIVDGYLEGASGAVTELERACFGLAGPLMAIENAARFLTDHLRGDTYFATTYDGQNLVRSRAQTRLADGLRQQQL